MHKNTKYVKSKATYSRVHGSIHKNERIGFPMQREISVDCVGGYSHSLHHHSKCTKGESVPRFPLGATS